MGSVYDFSQRDAQDLWIEDCVNATKTGFVDGCFADRVMDASPCCSNGTDDPAAALRLAKCETPSSPLSPAQCTGYRNGHLEVMNRLTEAISPGPIVANHAFTTAPDLYPSLRITGSMTENLPEGDAGIDMLRWHAQRGLLIEAHHKSCPKPGPARTTQLAQFLIGAGRLAYYGCGNWENDLHDWSERWFAEFERPLGDPVTDGRRNNSTGTWTRSFRGPHGLTNVTWDATLGGTIDWAGPYPPPPPPPPIGPTKECPVVHTNCALHSPTNNSVGFTVDSWQECCYLGGTHKWTAFEWDSVNPNGCTFFEAAAKLGPGKKGAVCGLTRAKTTGV